MFYHYTDRFSLADIRREGVIRAYPAVLYRDLLRQGESLTTPPLVWLSSNPMLDLTVLAKMQAGGWPMPPVGDLCRIVLPAGYADDEGLGEYTERVGIDHDWWTCVVRTGAMAGSDYTTWRIVDRDIPAADWLRCERLASLSPVTWEVYDRPSDAWAALVQPRSIA